MHSELTAAIDALGLKNEVPTLCHNAELTEQRVAESRDFLCKGLLPQQVPLDVVALGSMGRQESSTESDFDWLILAHGLPENVTHSRLLIELVGRKLLEHLLHPNKQLHFQFCPQSELLLAEALVRILEC